MVYLRSKSLEDYKHIFNVTHKMLSWFNFFSSLKAMYLCGKEKEGNLGGDGGRFSNRWFTPWMSVRNSQGCGRPKSKPGVPSRSRPWAKDLGHLLLSVKAHQRGSEGSRAARSWTSTPVWYVGVASRDLNCWATLVSPYLMFKGDHNSVKKNSEDEQIACNSI